MHVDPWLLVRTYQIVIETELGLRVLVNPRSTKYRIIDTKGPRRREGSTPKTGKRRTAKPSGGKTGPRTRSHAGKRVHTIPEDPEESEAEFTLQANTLGTLLG